MTKKVLLVSEYLNPPYDEGIKKTVYNLFSDLDNNYNLLAISRYAYVKENIYITNSNPLLISFEIRKWIKKYDPDVLIYFPFASSTFAGYLRMRVLSFFAGKARKLFIALQPKPLKKWQEFLVRFIKPKFALTPSPSLKKFWDSIGVKNELLPLLTDQGIFKPLADKDEKRILRKKYNLPEEAFIISHIGHLNENRNLRSLIPLQKSGSQVVVVGSSSTPKDSLGPENLKSDLQKEGIIILDGYIENIEEVYQLSDIYIFPVIAKTGSIGMPLSIMEARGCGIPVLTTDFGSLQYYLHDDYNSIWYKNPGQFLSAVKKIRNSLPRDFRKSKVEEINNQFYSIIHSAIGKQ